MGFSPVLWFGPRENNDRALDAALLARLRGDTARAILEETLRLGQGSRSCR